MSTYNRTTRECPVNELHPELYQAIQDYFQAQQPVAPEAEIVLCCETVSRKNPANRLVSWLTDGLAPTVYTGMLLTPQKLIWVRSAEGSAVVLAAADLKEIRVTIATSFFTHESRLEVRGYVEGFKGLVRGYIGIGPEPVAQKFCDEVRQAIAKVNPPPKRDWPKWFSRSS